MASTAPPPGPGQADPPEPTVPEAVDRLLEHLLLAAVPDAPALRAALDRSARAGLPPIAVSPLQGAFLRLLVGICGATRVLEVGTLGGYSTIWMAGGLPPEGRLVSLEREPAHAATARENLAHAGLDAIAEVRVVDAADGLAALAAERAPAFDLVFLDADKRRLVTYLELTLPLCRPGTVIVIDNVVRGGAVLDPGPGDESSAGAADVLAAVGRHPALEATALQTVGAKGHDGFLLARAR